MRTYVDANDSYSKALAQAHKHLPSLTKPEQVRAMVKFLVAENEKMQRDAADLSDNLEGSRNADREAALEPGRGPGARHARPA